MCASTSIRGAERVWRAIQQLNIETAEVEDLLIQLILDGKVKGKIDQQSGIVELERSYVTSLYELVSDLKLNVG